MSRYSNYQMQFLTPNDLSTVVAWTAFLAFDFGSGFWEAYSLRVHVSIFSKTEKKSKYCRCGGILLCSGQRISARARDDGVRGWHWPRGGQPLFRSYWDELRLGPVLCAGSGSFRIMLSALGEMGCTFFTLAEAASVMANGFRYGTTAQGAMDVAGQTSISTMMQPHKRRSL